MANRKLGRPTDQRMAMLRNQVTNLIWYGRIETTLARGKEVQSLAEHLVTIAMRQCDNTVEVTKKHMNDKKQVEELGAEWTDIAIVYPTKPGFFEDSGNACADLFWAPVEVDYNSEPLLDFAEKIEAMHGVTVTKCQVSGYDVTNMMFEAIEKAHEDIHEMLGRIGK